MSKNIDRRKILISLSGLATISFLGNEANADEQEVIQKLVDDISYFNEIEEDSYKIKIKEGNLISQTNPHLWFNIINDINKYQFSYAEFYIGPKSNDISITPLTKNCVIARPKNNKDMSFYYNNNEYKGKYLLFGNPKIYSQNKTRLGTTISLGSIEAMIENNNIKIDHIESNIPSGLSEIYRQIIKI